MPGLRGSRAARWAIGVATVLLLPVTGCGDATENYCKDLEEHTEQIAEMVGSDSPAALLDGLPMLHDLAAKAPEDLTDEWQTFLGALDGLDEAIEKSGVEASDFEDGKPPAGLSAADQKAIADAAGQVSSDDVVAASTGIEQQARDVCKVNLGLG
jgi:hypothetical protein